MTNEAIENNSMNEMEYFVRNSNLEKRNKYSETPLIKGSLS
jgi:hypothetical protein